MNAPRSHDSRFVVEVIGIDGAGKSSVVAALAASLDGSSRKVSPYGPQFEETATRVFDVLGAGAEDALRACAVAAALIGEAADPSPGLQLFDRYVEAARMFFSVKAERPLTERLLESLPAPDLVILLDLNVDLALTRRARRAGRSDAEERTYLEACRSYLGSAAGERGWAVIDAGQPLDAVVGAAEALVVASRRAERARA